jgi:hypothetical protein
VAEQAVKLARAELRELNREMTEELSGGKVVKVQFNPETLKVSFANQLVQPSGGGDRSGTPTRQFVGAGTTKLSMQLWFDVTAPQPDEQQHRDVRRLTQEVAYFITPKREEGEGGETHFVPPSARFLWGSFQFDGLFDSLEETIEFFSPDGRPLRASVSLAMSQQKITVFQFGKVADAAAGGGRTPRTPGTRPLAAAHAGATLQGLAEERGQGANWQSIASANGIENPRRLAPGQLIDLSARSRASAGGA